MRLSSETVMLMMCRRHMPYRAMKFKSVSVGIHMVCRSMSYGSPRMGNRASGMHGRSVQVMPVVQLFFKVFVTVFLYRYSGRFTSCCAWARLMRPLAASLIPGKNEVARKAAIHAAVTIFLKLKFISFRLLLNCLRCLIRFVG